MGTLPGARLQATGQRPLWVLHAERKLPTPDLFPQLGCKAPPWGKNRCWGQECRQMGSDRGLQGHSGWVKPVVAALVLRLQAGPPSPLLPAPRSDHDTPLLKDHP